MRTVQTRNNGNRFIEQYTWTIGMCITVQIGERGKFTDVQIGERGKQRVNQGIGISSPLTVYAFLPKNVQQEFE